MTENTPPRPFRTVALLGLGLIGSSIARAVREKAPDTRLIGFDKNGDVRVRARALGFCDQVADTAEKAVADAELVIICVPVGAVGAVSTAIAPHLQKGAVVSDVGSVKLEVGAAMRAALPGHVHIVPAHPVAGTEQSGPEAGFASLFEERWCILTPLSEADTPQNAALADAAERVATFWRALGSRVTEMDAAHHDRVLAITSHLPHLIAYTIVGVADDMRRVTESQVIKYSAAGFRDLTRIAASDPTMWRDVFLSNKDATLEILGRFTEELFALQRAIRQGDGDHLHDYFTRTRAIRRGIIEAGQDLSPINISEPTRPY